MFFSRKSLLLQCVLILFCCCCGFITENGSTQNGSGAQHVVNTRTENPPFIPINRNNYLALSYFILTKILCLYKNNWLSNHSYSLMFHVVHYFQFFFCFFYQYFTFIIATHHSCQVQNRHTQFCWHIPNNFFFTKRNTSIRAGWGWISSFFPKNETWKWWGSSEMDQKKACLCVCL